MEKMVSSSQKIHFHLPEWRFRFKNNFQLDEKKKLLLAGMSEK